MLAGFNESSRLNESVLTSKVFLLHKKFGFNEYPGLTNNWPGTERFVKSGDHCTTSQRTFVSSYVCLAQLVSPPISTLPCVACTGYAAGFELCIHNKNKNNNNNSHQLLTCAGAAGKKRAPIKFISNQTEERKLSSFSKPSKTVKRSFSFVHSALMMMMRSIHRYAKTGNSSLNCIFYVLNRAPKWRRRKSPSLNSNTRTYVRVTHTHTYQHMCDMT